MTLVDRLYGKLDSLHRKAHIFVACIALLGTLLIGSSLIAWHSGQQHAQLSAANRGTMVLLGTVHATRFSAMNALRGERGYLLTGDREYLKIYRRNRLELARSLSELEAVARANRPGSQAVADLRADISSFLIHLDAIDDLAVAGRHDEAIALIRRSGARDGIEEINGNIATILRGERQRLRSLTTNVNRTTVTMVRFLNLMSFAGVCLLALALILGVALRRSTARERIYLEELRKRAETDELTGISNRRELLTYLDRRIAEARRTRTPLSFAMFDIDNFKRVNDGYGHVVGDEVIKHVVRTAQGTVRVNDRIGRMGGEEFGIVLPKSHEDNAFMVCERMRGRLNECPFVLGDDQLLPVTISTGIAALTDDDDAASLIERADRALYEAKRSGRDQVRLAA